MYFKTERPITFQGSLVIGPGDCLCHMPSHRSNTEIMALESHIFSCNLSSMYGHFRCHSDGVYNCLFRPLKSVLVAVLKALEIQGYVFDLV